MEAPTSHTNNMFIINELIGNTLSAYDKPFDKEHVIIKDIIEKHEKCEDEMNKKIILAQLDTRRKEEKIDTIVSAKQRAQKVEKDKED